VRLSYRREHLKNVGKKMAEKMEVQTPEGEKRTIPLFLPPLNFLS
jgi:hypothetical protein